MAAKIKILVVDDIDRTRNNLRELLELEEDMAVIGEAVNGKEAVEQAKKLNPDIVLMDIGMPEMDGIQASEILTVELPQAAIIILTGQDERGYLRKAMAAGAREYLTKPPGREEMVLTIRRIYELEKRRRSSQGLILNQPDAQPKSSGKMINIFSTKGGVGKSTIAVNLAAAIAKLTGKKTALVDLNLQFGDIAMLLDLVPYRTISDLIGESDYLEPETLKQYLIKHSSGVEVLAAPLRPEFAEAVHSRQVEEILKVIRENYDYIIVDNKPIMDDLTLTALDAADLILMILALDVLTVKNVKLALETMAALHYEAAKIKLILNHASISSGISATELETSLKLPLAYSIPSEGKIALGSCNRGVPFVIANPKASVSKAIFSLARELSAPKVVPKKSRL